MQRPDGFGVGAVEHVASLAPDVDQADVAQHLQMLRHGRLAHPEAVDDVADRAFVGGEEREDVPPPRFGNGVERSDVVAARGTIAIIFPYRNMSSTAAKAAPNVVPVNLTAAELSQAFSLCMTYHLARGCAPRCGAGGAAARASADRAVTAVLSLAIGIGANSAIFTVANALLFRAPAGVAEPERLVDLGIGRPDSGFNPASYPTYLDIRQRSTTLEGVYAHPMFPGTISLVAAGALATSTASASASALGGRERVHGQFVTTNYFTVLGVTPAAGRLFGLVDSEQPGAAPVTV